MSAPTDRVQDPNSVSFYAPRGPRAVRLGQVAAAAAALIPQQPDGAAVRRSWADMPAIMDQPPVPRLRRRSLDPDVPPPPPLMPSEGTPFGSIAFVLMAVVAAAVIALFAVGPFSFFPSGDKLAHRPMELASTAARATSAVAPRRSEPVIPQLVVKDLHGNQGEPSPLGAIVRGEAEDAIVMITGLPPGATLSTGDAVGADAWRLAASDIGDAWIVPPKDFAGTVDLLAELRLADEVIAHRRTIRLEWAAAPTAAQTSATQPASGEAAAAPAAAEPAAAQPAATPARQLDREEVEVLIARAKTFIAAGDIAAARLLLQRAAEANDAEAALVLGATYDPFVLRELKVFGVAADLVTARDWYEKAKELGSPDAPRRLEILASAAR